MERNQSYGLFYIKVRILFFWSCWFFIAFLTNLTDFLTQTHIITETTFRSGNYEALEKVIEIYHTPLCILNFLFIMDLLSQGFSAFLFLIATICFLRNSGNKWPSINIAFGISVALWAVFLVMEEIFIAYPYE